MVFSEFSFSNQNRKHVDVEVDFSISNWVYLRDLFAPAGSYIPNSNRPWMMYDHWPSNDIENSAESELEKI